MTNFEARDQVVGMTEEEAKDFCETNEKQFRITERDGKAYLGTCDYHASRINVTLEQGVVVGAGLG